MLKRIKNNFFTGLLVILPIILTWIILTFLFGKINDDILNPLFKLLNLDFNNPYWVYLSKGGAFLMIILIISLIGWATRLILLRNFFGFWENLLTKVPMIGKVYLTIKQISLAFLGQGKYVFEKVVLIEYPRRGIYSLGFVTAQGYKEINQRAKTETVHIFLPTTPNPTNGYFLAVPKKDIMPLEMSVADGFKLIVSGGAFSPPVKSS
jgi:uncharacterized membrane protein